MPLTGVFAFAGIGINAGIKDYVKIVNEARRRQGPQGALRGRGHGLQGRPVDGGLQAHDHGQNKVNLYYADSTGFAKTINPGARPQRHAS